MILTLGSCSNGETSSSSTLAVEKSQENDDKEINQEVIVEPKEEIKEKSEEVKEETKEVAKDPTKMKYWVVFFDYDGTELQREALLYGTTPTYWSDIPCYSDADHWYKFVGWTNKKGKDKPFKPITGNTYYFAKYEVGGEISHDSPQSSGPACTNTNPLYYIVSTTGATKPPNKYEVVYQNTPLLGGTGGSLYPPIGTAGDTWLPCDSPLQADHWYHYDTVVLVPCTDPNHHGVAHP